MAAREGPLYRHTGPVLVRATTARGDVALPDGQDLLGDGEDERESARAWLARVWRREDVREAVQAASPVLSRRVDEVAAGRKRDARRERRIVASMASYLLRWQGRATPFGLFAGVTSAGVGEPAAGWGAGRQVVARADAEWLGEIIDSLERCPALLERLPVVANGVASVRGHRLVVPGQARDTRSGPLAPLEVSVRHTRPVRTALQAAREPVRFGELAGVLSGAFPTVPRPRIVAMLTELVAHGVLLTGLRAPMTVPDALGHVRSQLEAVEAGELPEVADVVAELRAIHDGLRRANRCGHSAQAAAGRARLARRMTAVRDAAAHPLVLGVKLDGEISVPASVIREAEAAASALLRLTAHPFGYLRWTSYHVGFRARFGPDAVVPVLDLLADSGLGLPADFLGAPPGPGGRMLTGRDETLLALVQQVAMDGCDEIELTEPVIRSLAAGDMAEMLPPPRAELAFQILAPSAEALASGAFRLVVTAAPRPGASMAGRFADLLPDAERDRLARGYGVSDACDPDAVAAQLSFPPRRRHSENVIRTPRLLPHVISLSEHREPGDGLIPLDDLAVSAGSRSLYLVQLSTGRRVEPRVAHALEAGVQTPPIARFLAEVPTGRHAVYGSFDWGAASHLPYLPRLRHGRSVLSPARWLLTADDLPGRRAARHDWDSALDARRRRRRVPAALVLVENELRLPLDLDHPTHRALLRARLDRAGAVELREGHTPADVAWIGRAHELLITMSLARPRAADRRQRTRAAIRDSGHLPGRSRWLCAHIPGHPDRQDEVLAEHVPRLLDGWGDPPAPRDPGPPAKRWPGCWWFRRHRETARPEIGQHLGLYLRLPTPELYGAAAARVGEWAADLRGRGLVPCLRLDTYHPETGRYGHGPAMAAAENVFAADSAAALAQIEMAARTGTPAQALAASGMLDLAVSYAPTPGQGLRWLAEDLPREPGKLDRALRDATLTLADPRRERAALRALPGGENVLLAWESRRAALVAYRTRLAEQRDPRPVLGSLLHLHHVRAVGVDPDAERVGLRLARAAALRQLAVHAGEETR
jgi:thiopeptide-type bacteriocin biosynthesis protein